MTTNFTAINTVITKAIEEAGIRENEAYKVRFISQEGELFEFEIETEWNIVSCFADLESTKILGIMATAKTIEEILGEVPAVTGRTGMIRKAA